MASSANRNKELEREFASSSDAFTDSIRRVLSSLASLRLTVFLFVLGLLLVFFGTLAQDKQGMWDVIKEYFRSFVVWVPLNTFFPRQWFGESWTSVGGGFWFLGGKSIGAALFVNLLAAHAVRFKVQTRGPRLFAGLGVLTAGIVLTFMVIASGNLKDGVQDQPMFEWRVLWLALVAGTGIIWGVMLAGLFRIPANRFMERILLMLGFALVTALLGWMVYWTTTGRRLDDSSLRILWQLIQGTVAGVVVLAGCILAFKKRAGVVLLHAGIGLMMLNELMVSQFAKEEQLRVREGETIGFTRNIQEIEVAVLSRDEDGNDEVLAIPESRLKPDKYIDDESMPFQIKVDAIWENSVLREKPRGSRETTLYWDADKSTTIEIDGGVGIFYDAARQPPVAGADASDRMDLAMAFVTLFSKNRDDPDDDGKIGTYMLSHQAYLAGVEEKVEVDGKEYRLAIRHKRDYDKPYEIRLRDVRQDTYIGTSMAKGFASDFEIIDRETGLSQPAKISMNNPLRYQGETFYQSGYAMDEDGVEVTTLQIVTNDGWMIPYVSCMLVVIGMVAHFGITLMRFLRREDADAPLLFGGTVAFAAAGWSGVALWREAIERKRRAEVIETEKKEKLKGFARGKGQGGGGRPGADDQSVDHEADSRSKRSLIIPAVVIGIGLILVLYYARPSSEKADEMQLTKAGQVPIVFDGRALPLDSYARNTLRMIQRRERYEDLDEEKQEAIRWIFEVMTNSDASEKFEVFRITNLEVMSLLDLPRRKSFKYSYEEINERRGDLEDAVTKIVEIDSSKRTRFQKAVLHLKSKLQAYEAILRVHQLPPISEEEATFESVATRLELAVLLDKQVNGIPLAVPGVEEVNDAGEVSWESYHVAATRQWLKEQAQRLGTNDAEELARLLLKEMIPDDETFFAQRLEVALLESITMFVRQQQPELSQREAIQEADRFRRTLEGPVRDQIVGNLSPQVRSELLEEQGSFVDGVIVMVGDGQLDRDLNPAVDQWTKMLKAYKDGNVDAFNEAVGGQIEYMAGTPAKDLRVWKISFESFYNHFAPLYVASVLYVFAFVTSVLGWLGWRKDFNRAAFWLLVLALSVHTFALLARMAISGRPPVTNLYSSAVFVGWGAVLICLGLEVVFRLGIGNVLASVAGFITLLIAYALSIEDDTFKVVVAVLDTQFWLATHVVVITFGYTTTFLAGGLGIVYVIAGIFTRALDKENRKLISRMLYGMVCFSIFFSFFGTVLGGLWADDSWGRFWGWDPKENGALLIVIWNALILHARWGGMVRERGIALLAIGGNIITTWSWFLVNQLGIGLHSYGFTEGVLMVAGIFVASQLAIIAIGSIPLKFWSSYAAHPSADMAAGRG